MYLLWDPAVFPHGAAFLVQEGVEVCCLDAAATPVLVPKQQQKKKIQRNGHSLYETSRVILETTTLRDPHEMRLIQFLLGKLPSSRKPSVTLNVI